MDYIRVYKNMIRQYKDIVCSEWLEDINSFKDFYEANYKEGFELMSLGEVYGEDNCILVPSSLMFHLKRLTPSSGTIISRGTRYCLYIRDRGRRRYYGSYGSYEKAVQKYYSVKMEIVENYCDILKEDIMVKIKNYIRGEERNGKI